MLSGHFHYAVVAGYEEDGVVGIVASDAEECCSEIFLVTTEVNHDELLLVV